MKKRNDRIPSKKNLTLSIIVIATIVIGYFYPLAGFIVPVVMLTGMIVGAIRGRYTCGNLCPRGAFFETFLPVWSSNREIPEFLRASWFRWSIVAVLMSFTAFQISRNPTSADHLGSVFWRLCAITTPVGIIGGLLYRPRFWCSFCPVGTLQKAMGGHRNRLRIDASSCKACKICEKTCPLNLEIVKHKEAGISPEKDCLKCRQCTQICPKGALHIPSFRERTKKTLGTIIPGMGRSTAEDDIRRKAA